MCVRVCACVCVCLCVCVCVFVSSCGCRGVTNGGNQPVKPPRAKLPRNIERSDYMFTPLAALPPSIKPNSIVITTLARARDKPFVSQAAWDFVVVDECLSIQVSDEHGCKFVIRWRQLLLLLTHGKNQKHAERYGLADE